VALKVLRAGILSTLQDLGRWGYQCYGVPVGGVMDEDAHRLANWLVGNEAAEATIEMTLGGPSLSTTTDMVVAVYGGDFGAHANGKSMPRARPVLVRAGTTLEFGQCKSGCRAYLAVAGGLMVPPVMNSRSTFLRGRFGGFHGRALKRGDVLETAEPIASRFPALWAKLERSGAKIASPAWSATERIELLSGGLFRIRFVPGRHWEAFSEAVRRQFCDAAYAIGPDSDRQGYRLRGPTLQPLEPVEVISEGVTFGTIQVPPDGAPIVLMASRQTIGGYPRLGEVVTVDLPLLAQLPPGAQVRFEAVTLELAQALLLSRERELARTREAIWMQAGY